MQNKLTCVFRSEAILAESPVWDEEQGELFWVDTPSGLLYSFDPRTKKSSHFFLSEPVAAVALRQGGGWILTMRDRIVSFDGKKSKTLASLEEKPLVNYFNDAKCDRQGRLWCGTKNGASPQTASAALYCLDATHTLSMMYEHVAQSNGMGWSPDSKIMYHTETMRHAIFAYDFDPQTAALSHRRIFAKIDPKEGEPDGLTVDSKGYVWSALYGKGKLVRFAPSGKVDLQVQLPVPHITSCAFGGEELSTLYITTAQENLSKQDLERYPLSGSLFALQVEVPGLPETKYVTNP